MKKLKKELKWLYNNHKILYNLEFDSCMMQNSSLILEIKGQNGEFFL